MDKLNREFLKGNVLKAEELNELVGKINELVDGHLIIGETRGTAYDGGAGAELAQMVRELAGAAGTVYSVYIRNNMPSLGFATQYGEECVLISASFPSTGTVWTSRTSLPVSLACVR